MARASYYLEHRARIIQLLATAEDAHARPPSVRALAADCGVGLATMHAYLARLGKEGRVTWRPGRHRSLRLVTHPADR